MSDAGPAVSKVYHPRKGLSIGGYYEPWRDRLSRTGIIWSRRGRLLFRLQLTGRICSFGDRILARFYRRGRPGGVPEVRRLDLPCAIPPCRSLIFTAASQGLLYHKPVYEPAVFFDVSRPLPERFIIPTTGRKQSRYLWRLRPSGQESDLQDLGWSPIVTNNGSILFFRYWFPFLMPCPFPLSPCRVIFDKSHTMN